MNWRERIEQRANVLCGEPVVRGTRVPVRALLGGLAGGMTKAVSSLLEQPPKDGTVDHIIVLSPGRYRRRPW